MPLSTFKSGGWALLTGWIFPSLIYTSFFAFFILPSLEGRHWVDRLLEQSLAERTTVLTGSAVAVGLVLHACSQSLYRVLEGYLLMPAKVRKWLTQRHEERRHKLWDEPDEPSETAAASISSGFSLEKKNWYPIPGSEVAPTRFGNVLRAAEHYGWDRYQLDAVTYWSGLLAHCPEPLRVSEERSKGIVDFFVASYALNAASLAVSLGLILSGEATRGTLLVVASAAALILSYLLAVSAARSWGQDIRTVVDVGRVGLRQSLGLPAASGLDGERTVWRALGWLRKYPYSWSSGALRNTSIWSHDRIGSSDDSPPKAADG